MRTSAAPPTAMRTAPTDSGDESSGASARAVPVAPHITAASSTMNSGRRRRIPRERTLGVVRVLRAILVLALVVGVVWIGQGVGLIRGSFMTGRAEWAVGG